MDIIQENVVKSHTFSKRLASIVFFACLFFSLSTATAQDGAGGDEAAADEAAADEAAADESESDGAPQEAETQEAKLDPNDPHYWAKVRDVYTVQKRPFQKSGRFSVTAFGGIIPNNIFEQYFPLGLRVDYFMLENIGIELAASYALKNQTDLVETVQDEQGINAQSPPLIKDSQRMHANFGILWSPFYGKTAFYDSALHYFDLYFFAGVGAVVTEAQLEHNQEPQSKTKVEGALGAGLAYYFGDHGAVRADFRQFVFQKIAPPNGPGGVANPSEVSLGYSWFF